jgi:hypothetical protein
MAYSSSIYGEAEEEQEDRIENGDGIRNHRQERNEDVKLAVVWRSMSRDGIMSESGCEKEEYMLLLLLSIVTHIETDS